MDKEKLEMVGEKRGSMNIALSPADKKFLKVYAAVIAECVARLRKEVGK